MSVETITFQKLLKLTNMPTEVKASLIQTFSFKVTVILFDTCYCIQSMI